MNLVNLLRNRIGPGTAVMVRLRDLAPYAALELILPGGSMMALLLWLYRRRKHQSVPESECNYSR
jgi:hypothetical protein